ncbi:hypothetical protein B0H14DRAFT_3058527, partial [Mycena olivaceomarginata]
MFHYTREFSWRSGAGGNLKISFRIFGGRTARESIAGIPSFSLLALRLGEFGGLDVGQLNPPEVELLLAAASVHESAVIVPPERDGVGAKAEGKRLVVVWRLTAARLQGSGCGFQRVQEQYDVFAVHIRFEERLSPSERDASQPGGDVSQLVAALRVRVWLNSMTGFPLGCHKSLVTRLSVA